MFLPTIMVIFKKISTGLKFGLIVSLLSFSFVGNMAQAAGPGQVDGIIYSDRNAQTQKSPTVQFFQNKVFVVHIGLNRQMYTSFCTLYGLDLPDCSGWNQNGGTTNEPLGMTVFNDRLYQVHRGDSKQIFTRSSADGVNWTGWTNNGGETDRMINLSVFNNRLYQVHRGGNRQIYTRSSADGTTWSDWVQSGGTTNDAVGMSATDTQICQVHRGESATIYTRCSSDGSIWSNWTESGGGTTRYAITMTTVQEGPTRYTAQFHRGDDGRIYQRGYGYTGWARFSESSFTDDSVSATANSSPTNVLCVAHRGLNNGIFLECDYLI